LRVTAGRILAALPEPEGTGKEPDEEKDEPRGKA